MENKKGIGPQRTAAAILFLWGFLNFFVNRVVASAAWGGSFSMSTSSWILQLCSLGIIILLFIGRRNIGFAIIVGFQVVLSIWQLAVYFNIPQLVGLVADIAMLVVVILATVPPFSERVSPLKNLEFIPAALYLLPYLIVLFTSEGRAGVMYVVNAIISSLAWWLMARALTAYDVLENAPASGASTYKTYVQPAAQPQPWTAQPAPVPAVSQVKGPGVLLVRFSIDALNKCSGSYGFQSGKLIGQAVPSSLLEGMTISDGDSAATLGGREYVCVVSISTLSNRSMLKEKIEPLILANEEIRACGAIPLTQIVGSTSEPLVVDGVVRNGDIQGPGGWCASGFMSAWKEQQEKAAQPVETASPSVIQESWTATNPRLSSNMPLSALLRVFLFTDGDGQSVLSCPVAMGTLADTVGASVNTLTGKFPVDVIARSTVGTQIMKTRQFPQIGWTAMAAIDSEKAAWAQAGTLRTCVRTFNNPDTKETGSLVLLYET
ncbi:MAG: hypothetical protein ACK5LX_05330 [Oscillospiraceae bacterium]